MFEDITASHNSFEKIKAEDTSNVLFQYYHANCGSPRSRGRVRRDNREGGRYRGGGRGAHQGDGTGAKSVTFTNSS